MIPADFHPYIMAAVVVLSLISFVKEWIPVEITALCASALLLVTGLLSSTDFLKGFSNSAPVTIACMFVMSAALERTGVIEHLGSWLTRTAKGSERRAMLLLLTVPLAFSAFMNNTPIVVIMMPVVLAFCRNSGVAPSRLLIPLSFATILGGTCTMIGTSTNLIVDGLAQEQHLPKFGLFDISKLGFCYAIIGGVFLWIFGPRLLPKRDTVTSLLTPEMMREFLVQVRVAEGSEMVGKCVDTLSKEVLRGVRVLEVRRRGVNLQSKPSETLLEPGDRLLLRTGSRMIQQMRAASGIDVGFGNLAGLQTMEQREAVIMEGIIGPNSNFIGMTLNESGFNQRYGLMLLALHRQGHNVTSELENLPLAFGDTLLVEGPREGINRLLAERDFVSLSEPMEKPMQRNRAWAAVTAMVAFVVFGSMNVDVTLLAFLGALGVVLAGCLKPSEAYEAVDWRTILLIIGMLGVGKAMETSGAAAIVAKQVTDTFGGYGPWVLLSATYLLTSILTEILSNNAVAALLTPIAVKMAIVAGVSPVPFVVAIMFGASASFATPIGYQTNTYIYGPGGYLFRDFLRIGIPMNIILWIAASFLIPWFWPLVPLK